MPDAYHVIAPEVTTPLCIDRDEPSSLHIPRAEPNENTLLIQHDINSCNESKLSSISIYFKSISVRQLQRVLGCGGAFTIFGTLFGSGIFVSPSLVTADIKDTGLALLVWLISGIICLMGSLCYCELALMIRKTGGNYIFLLNIYNDLIAFVFLWTQMILIDPAGIAVVTLTIGEYIIEALEMNDLIQPNPWYPKIIASVCIMLTAVANCISIKTVERLQIFYTMIQIMTIMFIVGLGCWQVVIGNTHNFEKLFTNVEFSWTLVGPVGSAFYKCLWVYNGWHLICNVTPEMINVERNLFRAVITAVPFVIVAYLAMNLAYQTTMTTYEISQDSAAAVLFVQKLLGKKVATLVPILVAVACFGSAHATIFSCPRGYLAAGKEGHLPKVLGMIHKDYYTPIPSIILLAVMSHILLLPRNSDLKTLIDLATLAMWITYLFIFVGIVCLRVREPNVYRSFKVWLIVPITMVIVSMGLIVVAFVERPIISTLVIAFISFGIPVYYGLIKNRDECPGFYKKASEYINKAVITNLNLAPFIN